MPSMALVKFWLHFWAGLGWAEGCGGAIGVDQATVDNDHEVAALEAEAHRWLQVFFEDGPGITQACIALRITLGPAKRAVVLVAGRGGRSVVGHAVVVLVIECMQLHDDTVPILESWRRCAVFKLQ